MNIVKIFSKLIGRNYWDTRYIIGNDSGYRNLDSKTYSDYVWSIINRNIGTVNDAIDVGCGDLHFWDVRDCNKYIGIDASEIIIEKNKKSHPKWKFIASSSGVSHDIHAETVICANTLYHIMDDDEYKHTIKNLIMWADRWLVIITWSNKPDLDKKDDSFYQKYRDFNLAKTDILSAGFSLFTKEKLPFDDYCCLWIFRRNKDV